MANKTPLVNYTVTSGSLGEILSTDVLSVPNITTTGAYATTGSTQVNYVTPAAFSVPTKINITTFTPGAFGQVMALGIDSSAPSNARVISTFDQRAGSHQPTLGTFDPSENDMIGFSWEGSTTVASVKTITNTITIRIGTTDALTCLSSGRVGVGVAAPTASLHLKAGSTAANSAPLKVDSGALLTTPVVGAFEFLTDSIYWTITTGAARKTIAFTTSNITGTAAGLSTPLVIASGGTGVTGLGTSLQVLRTNAAATATEWGTVSSGSITNNPGGSANQVQFYSAGAFGGATNVLIDNNELTLLANASPVSPATGQVKLFGRNIANRIIPAFVGPSGLDTTLQPHIGRNRAVRWQPIGNSTTVPIVEGILAPTALGTATSRTVATTNIATRTKRLGYVSATTAGAFAGHFFLAGAQQYTIGDGAGLGGFTSIWRFAVSDAAAVTGARQFIGWRNVVTTPTNVEPNGQTNAFGLAQISTDATQWYITYGGSAAQTAVALGTTIGAPTLTNTVWDFSLFAPTNSNNTVHYQLTNLSSGVVVTGTLTGTAGTALPASTALLAPIAWRCNNATLLAVGLDISSMYIETDQ